MSKITDRILQFKEQFDRCCAKADVYGWDVAVDPDEFNEIMFDENEQLIIRGVKTKYFLSDIKSIKYWIDEDDTSCVRTCLASDLLEGDIICFIDGGDVSLTTRQACGATFFMDDQVYERLNLECKLVDEGKDGEDFVISDGVLVYYQGRDTNVSIPEGVTTIGDRAFYKTSVETVRFPLSLVKINRFAFEGCTSLENVFFNEGLKSIGPYAFVNCKIEEIFLPNSITKIWTGAFFPSSLKKVLNFSESINIGEHAFPEDIELICSPEESVK